MPSDSKPLSVVSISPDSSQKYEPPIKNDFIFSIIMFRFFNIENMALSTSQTQDKDKDVKLIQIVQHS